ncbi:MAG TPA: hypothetical protein VGD46_13380 [Rhizobacter sp.]
MALVLAMQEGRAFYVDDTRVEVERVATAQQVTLKVVGKCMDQQFHLTDRDRTEILPGVYAQLGLGNSTGTVKIAVEAPKKVRILRDSLYLGEDAA